MWSCEIDRKITPMCVPIQCPKNIVEACKSANGEDIISRVAPCYALFPNVDSKMPTDIMASCRTELFGPSFSKKTCDAEQKSGFLVLLSQSGARKDVRVVVYRTSLEHFAVIYPRKRLSKPLGVVNLRNTAVERDEAHGFYVRQKGYDNTVTARFLCSERDMDGWLSAFSAPTSQTCLTQSLPVLVETEES